MTREETLTWLLTHAGVESEYNRNFIYNTLVEGIGFNTKEKSSPPSAEGAVPDNPKEQNKRMREWFKERTGLEDTLLSVHMEQIDVMLRDIHNKSQPTAEGAEEILEDEQRAIAMYVQNRDVNAVLFRMTEHTRIYAQKLTALTVDKRVEERLREELNEFGNMHLRKKFYKDMFQIVIKDEVDLYLKSREK